MHLNKCALTVLIPIKTDAFVCQTMKRTCNVTETRNKTPVVRSHTQETAQLSKVLRGWKFTDCLNFGHIRRQTSSRNSKTQKVHTWFGKTTLRQFKSQSSSIYSLRDIIQILQMLLKRTTHNQNIIYCRYSKHLSGNRPFNTASISRWNGGTALVRPNGIRKNSK